MTVLTRREEWRRPAALAVRAKAPELTEEERAHLQRALRFLRVRAGSGPKLAAALGIGVKALDRAIGKRVRGGALLALRAARLAGIPVEDVLSGAWPSPEACPHCGRS
jgi:hypothetical protein